MRYSKIFAKTNKSAPHDADSPNARLLAQAGFINQSMSGVYSYLPLGLRVLNKIKQIVREEMDALGANEILMPALHSKNLYDTTERWDSIDVLFKLKGSGKKEYALGSTHEEVVTPLVKEYVKSYKDLPVAVYQIQDKFRDEPRAKSGLLRGREFSMKDLYSFHLTEEDFNKFYEKSKESYLNVFSRCGLDAVVVEASGGVFSKFSHEFQVKTEYGEDTIFNCKCGFAQNKEIAEVKEDDDCPKCGTGKIQTSKSIEVGNIFPLKNRFTKAFGFKVQGQDGKQTDILMGCYGIGPSRVMGSVVEVHHDDKGIVWPKAIAPFNVHLISIKNKDEAIQEKIMGICQSLHDELNQLGVDVLWDDRENISAGQKFADADLIGNPLRIVVSEKTLADNSVEWKERHESESKLVSTENAVNKIKMFIDAPDNLTSH